MSTNIIPFSYADHPVRVIQINGEPWFVPSDVCAILGHRNASQAVAQHVHADDSMRATLTIREGSRDVTRERTLVNEWSSRLGVNPATVADTLTTEEVAS